MILGWTKILPFYFFNIWILALLLARVLDSFLHIFISLHLSLFPHDSFPFPQWMGNMTHHTTMSQADMKIFYNERKEIGVGQAAFEKKKNPPFTRDGVVGVSFPSHQGRLDPWESVTLVQHMAALKQPPFFPYLACCGMAACWHKMTKYLSGFMS